MGLGNRDARRHETRRTAGVDPSAYWDFQPGQQVMTVDGFLGQVVSVYDGPVGGSEAYEVELQNGLGGGQYTASQLRATTDHRASHEHESANTASHDYPELREILTERLDPGRYPSSGAMSPWMFSLSSKQAASNEGAEPTVCENGHLQWGNSCPACRNADPSDNAMVVNEGDNKPQDTERQRNAAREANPFVRDAAKHDQDDEWPECEECGGDHHTSEHQECEICGSQDHETDDHEDEPQEDDDYLTSDGYGRRGSWRIHHGVQGFVGSQDCSGPHEDHPDLETAAHVLMHCQHERGYFPNAWDNSYGSGHEMSGAFNAHVHRWGPNIGASNGPVHRGAEPLPERPLPGSHDDMRSHLMHQHGVASSDLYTHWGGPLDFQDLHNLHAETHSEGECPVERDWCPWNRSEHHHGGVEQEMHEDHYLNDDDYGHSVADVWNRNRENHPEPDQHDYNPAADRARLEQAERRAPGSDSYADMYHHLPGHGGYDDMPQEGESMADWIKRTTPAERFSKCDTCRGKGQVRKPGIPPEGVNPWEHKQPCPKCQGSGHLRSDGTPAREQGGHLARLAAAFASSIDSKDWWEHYNTKDGCEVCGDSEHDTHEHDLVDNAINPSLSDAYLLRNNPIGPSKYSSFDPYALIREASLDPSLGFHVMASWADVRDKAKRIRSTGGVNITTVHNGFLVANVKGDHNVYEAILQRVPGRQAVGAWHCGCKWSAYSFDRSGPWKRFEGRMCSHALALHYEAQKRGMFGANPKADRGETPNWLLKHKVVERYDPDTGKNLYAASRRSDETPLGVFVFEALKDGEDPEEVALFINCLGAVSSPFGEPGPTNAPPEPGPTKPRDSGENPAQAGFLTATDPTGWDRQNPQDLGDRMASQHLAHGDHGHPEVGPYHDTSEPWDEGLHKHPEPGRTAMPGLGCPHCDGGFFSPSERTQHIREHHPGEYSGPDAEMLLLSEMRPDIFGDLGKSSMLDDSLDYDMPRQASMDKESWAQMIVPLVRAVAPQIMKKVVPPLLLNKAEEKGEEREQENEVSSQQARDETDQVGQNFAQRPFQAMLDDEPEPALPQTDGADEDGDEVFTMADTHTAMQWPPDDDSLEYGYPTDPGNSNPAGQTTVPSSTLKNVSDDALSPESPSMQTVGSYFTEQEMREYGRQSAAEQGTTPEVALGAHIVGQEQHFGMDMLATAQQVIETFGLQNLTTAEDLVRRAKEGPQARPTMPDIESTSSTGSVQDIVAQFQATAGAKALDAKGAQTQDTSDIAAAAKAHLAKTSMAQFSPAQQQELINEGENVRAGNFDRLQIEGTHYEALDAALGDDEDDEVWTI